MWTAVILGCANGSGCTGLAGSRGYTFAPASGDTVEVRFGVTGNIAGPSRS